MLKLVTLVGVFLLVFSSGVIIKDWGQTNIVTLDSSDDYDYEININFPEAVEPLKPKQLLTFKSLPEDLING